MEIKHLLESHPNQTIFFVTFCLLTCAKNFVLLRNLLLNALKVCVLFDYAALTAESLNTGLILVQKTFAGFPFTVCVAFTCMAYALTWILEFTLVGSTQCFHSFFVGKIIVGISADAETTERLFLQRFDFLEHLIVDVRLPVALEAHYSGSEGTYSMRECFLVREECLSTQLGRSRDRQLERLDFLDQIEILMERWLRLVLSSIKMKCRSL